MKVGVLLPTNNPRAMMDYFCASLRHLDGLQKHFKFLINFNGPKWDPIAVAQVMVRFDLNRFEATYCLDPTESAEPSMFALRAACADLDLACDLFMFVDDNLKFTYGTEHYPRNSATRYKEVIDYMSKFGNCGSVQCEGTLGGSGWGFDIRPTTNGLVATTRGLFVRNAFSHLFTPEERALKGTLEETCAVYRLVHAGYYHAKQFNNPTQHKEKKKHGPDAPGIHNDKLIAANGLRHIRETYGDPDWTHDGRKFPKSMRSMKVK